MTLAIRRNLQAGGSPVAAADALLRLEGVLAAVVAGTTAFEAALLPSQHRPRLV